MNYHLSAMHDLEQAEREAGYPSRGPLTPLAYKPERRIPRWAWCCFIFGLLCVLLSSVPAAREWLGRFI